MRHKQDGELCVVPKLHQLILHLAAGERVERGKGFVHQQDVWLHGHAARNRHALLHAARKRMRIAVCKRREVDLVDVGQGAFTGGHTSQRTAGG